MDVVTLEGTDVIALSPEGQKATMSLQAFLDVAGRSKPQTCGPILPDGVKYVATRGPVTVWVHETPPRVFSFRWIAPGSPVPFGANTQYRTVRIALPYVLVFAVFEPGEHGVPQLGNRNECFFRSAPLDGLDDELAYPALLNCSKFTPQNGHPLSWICTAQMSREAFCHEPDLHKRLRAGLRTLLRCLFETAFNLSSEHHEGSSWYTESRHVDKRIHPIENWEKATDADRLFPLEVPWLKTGHTVTQLVERIFEQSKLRRPPLLTSRDAARIVFNHAQTSSVGA